MYEKYLQLARDANTAGDRVTAENMFQHAEHYFRVLNVEERESQARLQNRSNGEDGQAGQPPSRGNGAEHRQAPRQPRNETQPRAENSSGSEPESGAKADQPSGHRDDTELPGGDASGEEDLAPVRPQRRVRRGNGRATSPNRDTVEIEASEGPAPTEDVTETPVTD